MKLSDIVRHLRGQQQSYIAFAKWFIRRAGGEPDDMPGTAIDAVADLARFCRYGQTCFHEDARVHAALEGRREAFQRILDHLSLTPEQLIVVRRIPINKEADQYD